MMTWLHVGGGMPSRRLFIAGSLASLATAQETAFAEHRIGMSPFGPVEIAEFPLNRYNAVYATQRCNMWCWAATLEMLFRAHGFDLPQELIVDATYGARVCRTGEPWTLVANTNRVWRDVNGNTFRARTLAAYDAYHGINAINNDMIISALIQDRPLIYCNQTHMMLLTSIEYVRRPFGVQVGRVGFFDPWPQPTPGTSGPLRGTRGATEREKRPVHSGGDMVMVMDVAVEPI
jgi:hypothetical protein